MSNTTEAVAVATDKSAFIGPTFESFDFSSVDESLESMLKSGVHFGHLKSRLHPRMSGFVYTTRQNVNIIDLEKTSEYLKKAEAFLAETAKGGKPILFVGMKKHTHTLVRSLAERLGEPYIVDRWLGGTLTNFSCIRTRANYLRDLEEKLSRGELSMYTKFERQKKTEEVERLEKKMGGIKNLRELPGAIVVADGKEAKLAIREARAIGVPIVAIMDTNADPSAVEHPVPGNDDALSSIRFILGALGRAIADAKGSAMRKADEK